MISFSNRLAFLVLIGVCVLTTEVIAGSRNPTTTKKMEDFLGKETIEYSASRSLNAPPPPPMESHDVISVNYGKDVHLIEGNAEPEPGSVSRNIGVRKRERPVEQPKVDFEIPFSINSHRLEDRAAGTLSEIAAVLRRHETARLVVNGHTDRTTGTYEWNMELSALRALSVIKYLVEEGGIKAHRLEGNGYGPNATKYPEHTEASRSRNRRVEFELVGK